MLLGFGLIGGAMRYRRQSISYRFGLTCGRES
jgi:hypothetical protein